MKLLRNILGYLTLGLMATGCTGADEPVPGVDVSHGAQVSFKIAMNDGSTREGMPISSPAKESRTPGDGPYEEGVGYENYIDIKGNDFRFIFFNIDDTYAGELEVTSFAPTSYSPGARIYNVTGIVKGEIASLTDFKLCVLANWGSYPSLAIGDPLDRIWSDATAIFNRGDGTVGADKLIPMYGIKEFSGIEFLPDGFTPLDIVRLLRAVAKVEVSLDNSVYPVESITLTRVNATGFKAPKDVRWQGDYVHGSYHPDYANTPNIPATEVETEVLLYPTDASKRAFTIYVPEFDNRTVDADRRTRLRVRYESDKVNDKFIDFKYYHDPAPGYNIGDPFDLLRNYLYRFEVSQKSVELDLDIVVDIQPYAEVELKPDFGLERDDEGYIIVRDKNGHVVKYIRTDGAELTLELMDMPGFGVIMGVFDSKRRALIGYLLDGRSLYFNYADEHQTTFISWEIYSLEDENLPATHLEEEYILDAATTYPDNAATTYTPAFCHNFYDHKGRLIERFSYPDNATFEKRQHKGDGGKQLVGYTGAIYGAKEITYYDDKDGMDFMKIIVTVGADGLDTDTYMEKNKDGVYETTHVDKEHVDTKEEDVTE